MVQNGIFLKAPTFPFVLRNETDLEFKGLTKVLITRTIIKSEIYVVSRFLEATYTTARLKTEWNHLKYDTNGPFDEQSLLNVLKRPKTKKNIFFSASLYWGNTN